MLGLVFTEFMDLVETAHGPEMLDAVLARADLGHDGVYTAVGNYSHNEMIKLVVALVAETGGSVDDAVHGFGKYLAERFSTVFPNYFLERAEIFDFLESIEPVIHREVRALYPEAKTPEIWATDRSDTAMVLHYRSHRPLANLALGLLEGVAGYYKTPLEVTVKERAEDGRHLIVQVSKSSTGTAG